MIALPVNCLMIYGILKVNQWLFVKYVNNVNVNIPFFYNQQDKPRYILPILVFSFLQFFAFLFYPVFLYIQYNGLSYNMDEEQKNTAVIVMVLFTFIVYIVAGKQTTDAVLKYSKKRKRKQIYSFDHFAFWNFSAFSVYFWIVQYSLYKQMTETFRTNGFVNRKA